jgi:hypothetical protein
VGVIALRNVPSLRLLSRAPNRVVTAVTEPHPVASSLRLLSRAPNRAVAPVGVVALRIALSLSPPIAPDAPSPGLQSPWFPGPGSSHLFPSPLFPCPRLQSPVPVAMFPGPGSSRLFPCPCSRMKPSPHKKRVKIRSLFPQSFRSASFQQCPSKPERMRQTRKLPRLLRICSLSFDAFCSRAIPSGVVAARCPEGVPGEF